MEPGKGGAGKGRGAGRKAAGPVLSGAVLLMAVAVLVRLALLGVPALCDNTESRYGIISLEMARTGDWLTPRLWYNGVFQPFWGKPPMHFWATVAVIRIFGPGEMAARLPGFLDGLVILLSAVLFARRFWGPLTGAVAGAVLSSTLLFFGLSGSCTTDITLAAFLAVAMASFAFSAGAGPGGGRYGWGLLFFAALAGGVLAKGPVALVLAGLALAGWSYLAGRWSSIRRLPWGSGIPLFLLLSVPWFIAAERATPGFLRYYFVSEHFLRYIRHDYGDLYGGGHQRPWGTIWPLLAASFLPWIFSWYHPVRDFFRRPSARNAVRREAWLVYALAWGLAPAVFFTFARQVLPTYLAPSLAGLSIATAVGMARRGAPASLRSGWMALALYAVLLVAGGGFVSERFSAKEIIRAVSSDPRLAGRPVSFPMGEPYSGDFYSLITLGKAMAHDPALPGEGRVRAAIGNNSREILLVPRRKFGGISAPVMSRLEEVAGTRSWAGFTVKGVK